jgi:hypothetical protein
VSTEPGGTHSLVTMPPQASRRSLTKLPKQADSGLIVTSVRNLGFPLEHSLNNLAEPCRGHQPPSRGWFGGGVRNVVKSVSQTVISLLSAVPPILCARCRWYGFGAE